MNSHQSKYLSKKSEQSYIWDYIWVLSWALDTWDIKLLRSVELKITKGKNDENVSHLKTILRWYQFIVTDTSTKRRFTPQRQSYLVLQKHITDIDTEQKCVSRAQCFPWTKRWLYFCPLFSFGKVRMDKIKRTFFNTDRPLFELPS